VGQRSTSGQPGSTRCGGWLRAPCPRRPRGAVSPSPSGRSPPRWAVRYRSPGWGLSTCRRSHGAPAARRWCRRRCGCPGTDTCTGVGVRGRSVTRGSPFPKGVCGWAGTAAGSPEHARAQPAAGRVLLVSRAVPREEDAALARQAGWPLVVPRGVRHHHVTAPGLEDAGRVVALGQQ